ncbi:probable glutamate receptor [Eriocheir sinensis]|uniref:probable glutamate receptor n=1 Tax=Eriocheir sinensis TaxID=95602 RepID=UPI0021C70583|nr:probable glutamate receptor [Eriocheir sinensis]
MAQPLQKVLMEPEVVRGLTQDPATFRFPRRPLVVAGAVHWPPHVGVTHGPDGLGISGAMANVMQVLAETLNFTYTIVTPADGSWGAERSNGTWTGMVGQVVEKKADVAVGPFGITLRRSQVVDFTESFYFDDRSILAKKGVPEIDHWGFLYPLTSSVWAAMMAVLAMVWVLSMVLLRRPKGVGLLGWWGELLLENIRILLNQGVKKTLLLGSSKIRNVSGLWVVVAAVVFWSYSGTLTSLLAVRFIPQPIQTLRDLLDDPSLTVIMEPNTIVTDTIAKMKFGELRELHELQFVGRVRYQHASTFPRALDTQVRRQRHVIISTSLSAELFMADIFTQTGSCDFYKARQSFFTSTHCMIGPKDSLLVPAINHRIRALIESGLYEHWLLSDIPALTTCRSSPPIVLVRAPLSLANLWGAVVLLGAGQVLALLAFCIEMLGCRVCP